MRDASGNAGSSTRSNSSPSHVVTSRRSRDGGIKDSPPYLHDGRCLTLEDTVEFFNLIQGLKLSKQEKAEPVAFLRTL